MLKTDITVCLKTIYLWSWVQICSADKYGGGWICGYMCEVGCICGCMCGGSCIFGCMCGGSYICGFVEVVVFVATSVKEVAFGYMCGGRSICGYRCEGGCIYGYKCGVCCICGQVKKKAVCRWPTSTILGLNCSKDKFEGSWNALVIPGCSLCMAELSLLKLDVFGQKSQE